MKHIISCSCITLLSLTLASCTAEGASKKKNTKTTQGTSSMNRVKSNSGLEYEILRPGDGKSPERNNRVTVHYTGWLDQNGTPGSQFDSSVDRGTPFTFIIGRGQVIQGWDEGVASMKIGEKRRLFIPSKLGYGAHGAGRSIPPHANLIFDVELISIS